MKEVSVLKELLYLFIKIVVIIGIFLILFTLLFGICRSQDRSMYPAIKDGDLLIHYRLDKNYVKSDVLVLKQDGEKQIRRVVAVEGDEVDISEEGLYINGFLQQEMDIHEETKRYDTDIEFPLTVGEDQVFVLGDGRENATDSRVYGCVDKKDTLGKAMTVIRRRGI